jgi:hypothetical protein
VRQLCEIGERAADVDQHELSLVRRERRRDPAGEQPQQARLACLGVAEHEQVRVAADRVQDDRLEPPLLQPDRDRVALRGRQVGGSSSRGSSRIGSAPGPPPTVCCLLGQAADRIAQPLGRGSPSNRGSAAWKCVPPR